MKIIKLLLLALFAFLTPVIFFYQSTKLVGERKLKQQSDSLNIRVQDQKDLLLAKQRIYDSLRINKINQLVFEIDSLNKILNPPFSVKATPKKNPPTSEDTVQKFKQLVNLLYITEDLYNLYGLFDTIKLYKVSTLKQMDDVNSQILRLLKNDRSFYYIAVKDYQIDDLINYYDEWQYKYDSISVNSRKNYESIRFPKHKFFPKSIGDSIINYYTKHYIDKLKALH